MDSDKRFTDSDEEYQKFKKDFYEKAARGEANARQSERQNPGILQQTLGNTMGRPTTGARNKPHFTEDRKKSCKSKPKPKRRKCKCHL
jgi:hypothetical protein